jgi:RNA-binding protein
MEITPTERRALRARAHHLQPVVIIGDAGIRPAVLREIDVALKHHELIKVRLMIAEREDRAGMAAEIAEAVEAAVVQTIGRMFVLYRPPSEDEKKAAIKKQRPRRREPRRTKRSYQMQ